MAGADVKYEDLERQTLLDEANQRAEKYNEWKDSINDQKIATFVTFCIQRISHSGARDQFIDYIVTTNRAQIEKLFEMLGINIATQDLEITIVDGTVASAGSLKEKVEGKLPDIYKHTVDPKTIPRENHAPFSPAVQQFTSFQEWMSGGKREGFNEWLMKHDTKFRKYYQLDKEQKISRSEQMKFLEWYKKKMKPVFDYYESLLDGTDKKELQSFRNNDLPKLIKQTGLEKMSLQHFLEKIREDIKKINGQLSDSDKKVRDKESVKGHYIYDNSRADQESLYQEYLNEGYFRFEKKRCEVDPEGNMDDILESMLSATEKDVLMPSSKKVEAPEVLQNEKVNVYKFTDNKDKVIAEFYLVPSSIGSEKEECGRVRDKLKYINNTIKVSRGDVLFDLNDQSLEDLTILRKVNFCDENGHKVTCAKKEGVIRHEMVTDDQRELMQVVLERNKASLINFYEKHSSLQNISYSLTSFAYVGEFAYVGADLLVRSASLWPLLKALDLEAAMANPAIVWAFNILGTVLVSLANVAFDPIAMAEDLMGKYFLNPIGSEQAKAIEILRGYLRVQIGITANKMPILTTSFFGMALAGAAMEILALEFVKNNASEAAYNWTRNIGTPLLIISGLLYYFFFNFGDMSENTLKACEMLKNILKTISSERDPGKVRAAWAILMQFLTSFFVRILQMSYGPYVAGEAFGFSKVMCGALAFLGAVCVVPLVPATRLYAAGKKVYDNVSDEKMAVAEEKYKSYAWGDVFLPHILDPSIVPTVAASYVAYHLFSEQLKSLAATALVFGAGYYFFYPLVKTKYLLSLAKDNSKSMSYSDGIFSSAVGFDQFSRALGFVAILRTLRPDVFNLSTPEGKLAIILGFALSSWAMAVVFDYQRPKSVEALASLLNKVQNSQFVEDVANGNALKSAGNALVSTVTWPCKRAQEAMSSPWRSGFTVIGSMSRHNSQHGQESDVEMQNNPMNSLYGLPTGSNKDKDYHLNETVHGEAGQEQSGSSSSRAAYSGCTMS